MSHDEIETSHVNECDRPVPPIGWRATLESISAQLGHDVTTPDGLRDAFVFIGAGAKAKEETNAKRISELKKERDGVADTARRVISERDAAIEEARTSKILADESRADAANLRTQLVDMARDLAFERAQVATIGHGASVLRGERDRALAELAEERRFVNRLFNALRSGE